MCVHYNYNYFTAYEVHLEFAGLSDEDYARTIFDTRTIFASDEKHATESVSHLIRLEYSSYRLHQASLRQYGSYGEIKFAKHMTQFDLS